MGVERVLWAVFVFVPHLQFTLGASVFLRWEFVFVVAAAAAAASAVIIPAAVSASVGSLRHLFGEGGHSCRMRRDRLHHRHEG